MKNKYWQPLLDARAAVQAARCLTPEAIEAAKKPRVPYVLGDGERFTGNIHPDDEHMRRRRWHVEDDDGNTVLMVEPALAYAARVHPPQPVKVLPPKKAAKLRAALAACEVAYELWIEEEVRLARWRNGSVSP